MAGLEVYICSYIKTFQVPINKLWVDYILFCFGSGKLGKSIRKSG
jgi:hypothetical protein